MDHKALATAAFFAVCGIGCEFDHVIEAETSSTGRATGQGVATTTASGGTGSAGGTSGGTNGGESGGVGGSTGFVLSASQVSQAKTLCAQSGDQPQEQFASAAALEADLVGTWVLCSGAFFGSPELGMRIDADGTVEELVADDGGNAVPGRGFESVANWSPVGPYPGTATFSYVIGSGVGGMGVVIEQDPLGLRLVSESNPPIYVLASAPASDTPVDGACPAPLTLCGSVCTSLQVDPQNCGGCGQGCGQYLGCYGGVCQ